MRLQSKVQLGRQCAVVLAGSPCPMTRPRLYPPTVLTSLVFNSVARAEYADAVCAMSEARSVTRAEAALTNNLSHLTLVMGSRGRTMMTLVDLPVHCRSRAVALRLLNLRAESS